MKSYRSILRLLTIAAFTISGSNGVANHQYEIQATGVMVDELEAAYHHDSVVLFDEGLDEEIVYTYSGYNDFDKDGVLVWVYENEDTGDIVHVYDGNEEDDNGPGRRLVRILESDDRNQTVTTIRAVKEESSTPLPALETLRKSTPPPKSGKSTPAPPKSSSTLPSKKLRKAAGENSDEKSAPPKSKSSKSSKAGSADNENTDVDSLSLSPLSSDDVDVEGRYGFYGYGVDTDRAYNRNRRGNRGHRGGVRHGGGQYEYAYAYGPNGGFVYTAGGGAGHSGHGNGGKYRGYYGYYGKKCNSYYGYKYGCGHKYGGAGGGYAYKEVGVAVVAGGGGVGYGGNRRRHRRNRNRNRGYGGVRGGSGGGGQLPPPQRPNDSYYGYYSF